MAMLIFMLSLGGIPPTAGFMGKFWVFGAAIEAGYIWLAVIGVLNSAVSLYYYVRVVVFMWLTTPEDTPIPIHLSPAIVTVLALMVIATLVFGVYPRALFEFAEQSAASLGAVPSALGSLGR
jgi:NADH-quinone oxidoreductase subunit N